MTKKRFTLKNWDNYAEGDCIYYDNGEEMGSLDVLDTLNNLSKENEQLKLDLKVEKDGCNLYYELNEELEKQNKELKDKNSQLQETLAFRSNQLSLIERLVDDLGSEEMTRQMEEILND